ncbi:MAG TPA: sulfotransferase [Alphaproteobacteria bacterium]|nr:sulfotransferase [Alphaproteobacteria bacterium]
MVPVFILGMYRSGTSWLLRSLCAHPAIRGVPELDLVRPTLRADATEARHIRPRSEWLHQFFADNRWARLDIVSLLDSRLRPIDNLEAGITELAEAMGRSFARDPKHRARLYDIPLGFRSLTVGEAAELIRALHAAPSQPALVRTFVSMHARYLDDPPFFVTKTPNGLIGLDIIRRAFATAKILVIVRDGRDVALSATHFRRLKSLDHLPYEELLQTWAQDAAAVAAAAQSGKLGVIRYEDLSRDFIATFARTLEWLGADAEPSLLRRIEAATSFEAMTGRPRGQADDVNARKGAAHDWIDALGENEKQRAWEIAGSALEQFGYGRSDTLEVSYPGKI